MRAKSKKLKQIINDFVIKEWLFILSLDSLVITSYYLKTIPKYTQKELIPVFLLFALFIVIKGVENTHLLLKIATILEKEIKRSCNEVYGQTDKARREGK